MDIGVKSVKQYYVSPKPSKEVNELLANYGMTADDLSPSVFMVADDSEEYSVDLARELQVITPRYCSQPTRREKLT